jgi:hypothetical protein
MIKLDLKRTASAKWIIAVSRDSFLQEGVEKRNSASRN